MATTTTNYGFDIPQSTDLVKDGATAIATLGQDIDTAMNTALGTKKAGMVLLNTTSFSGVSSQSINNVFTSTYDSYKIIFSTTAVATTGIVTMRLRASSVDTSTNYKNQGSFSASTTISSSLDDAGTDEWILTYINTGTPKNNSFQGVFHRPNVAQPTLYTGLVTYGTNSTGFIGGWQTDSTQFDGLTFIAPGNITGTISIYGFSK